MYHSNMTCHATCAYANFHMWATNILPNLHKKYCPLINLQICFSRLFKLYFFQRAICRNNYSIYFDIENRGKMFLQTSFDPLRYPRSILVLKLYNNGNSNPSCHLYIWFTCKFYWVRFIYCFWATSQQLRDPFEEHGD